MLNRWIGIVSGCLMILAVAAVFWRDVLPGWLIGDPPPTEIDLLAPGEKRQAQVGIYDSAGRAVGTSWTVSSALGGGDIALVTTTTVLGPLPLPGGVTTPRVCIQTEITYLAAASTVDQLEFHMYGLGMPIELDCVALPTGDFPCAWKVGTEHGEITMDSRVPAALGDVIRPFDRLPDLYVGRRWRLKLLYPLAQMVPQLKQVGMTLEEPLIEVTGRERIETPAGLVDAFVVQVENGGATAWVHPDGRVLRQEVNVPLLGQLVLLDEPFDEEARLQAVRSVPGKPEAQRHDAPQESDHP